MDGGWVVNARAIRNLKEHPKVLVEELSVTCGGDEVTVQWKAPDTMHGRPADTGRKREISKSIKMRSDGELRLVDESEAQPVWM